MTTEVTGSIDLRPEVHLADESIEKLDEMVRTLAWSLHRFQLCVAIGGLEAEATQIAWRALNDAAGELWTEGLR